MKELSLEARVDNLDQVLQFIDEQLEEAGCPMKVQVKIDIAVEEMYVNVASYAYAPGTGPVTVRMEFEQEPSTVIITFIDRGIPYDPLQKQDPDVSLSAEKRAIGGLGIFLVKKTMDVMLYERRDDCNVLTIRKKC